MEATSWNFNRVTSHNQVCCNQIQGTGSIPLEAGQPGRRRAGERMGGGGGEAVNPGGGTAGIRTLD